MIESIIIAICTGVPVGILTSGIVSWHFCKKEKEEKKIADIQNHRNVFSDYIEEVRIELEIDYNNGNYDNSCRIIKKYDIYINNINAYAFKSKKGTDFYPIIRRKLRYAEKKIILPTVDYENVKKIIQGILMDLLQLSCEDTGSNKRKVKGV